MGLAGAAAVGAAAVGLAWLFLGGSGAAPPTVASFTRASTIPPPDYAYLDNARVALYLGQLEGGLAKSEQLTQQLTQGKSAGVTAGGLSLGGTTGSAASAERIVTPTASARFYELLGLLQKDGYLHTIDAAAAPKKLVHAFSRVEEGTFVRLKNCTLRMPSYVQLGQLTRSSGGFYSATNQYAAAGQTPPLLADSRGFALMMAGRIKYYLPSPAVASSAAVERRLERAIRAVGRLVAKNPRVPVSTCDGKADFRPRGVDLLFPIRLAGLSSEQTLLAGPVTILGKLVRSVRKPGEEYVDGASLATFSGPISAVDGAVPSSDTSMAAELAADTVVLAPGAVILPIAIYK